MKIAIHVFEPLIYRFHVSWRVSILPGSKHLSHECETRHKVTLSAEQAGNLGFGMHFLLGLISICKQICVLWQVNGLILSLILYFCSYFCNCRQRL